eukprot:6931814-Lingulodinium_polyedra.AAC.1
MDVGAVKASTLAQSRHGHWRSPQTQTQTKLQGSRLHTHLFKVAPGPKPLKMLVFWDLGGHFHCTYTVCCVHLGSGGLTSAW